jgi:hypothetical protein
VGLAIGTLFVLLVVVAEAEAVGIVSAAAVLLGFLGATYLSWRRHAERSSPSPPRGWRYLLAFILVAVLFALIEQAADPGGVAFLALSAVVSGLILDLYFLRREESREVRGRRRLSWHGPLLRLLVRRSLAGMEVTFHAGEPNELRAEVRPWGPKAVLFHLPGFYLDHLLFNDLTGDTLQVLDVVERHVASAQSRWRGEPQDALARQVPIVEESADPIVARSITIIGRVVRATKSKPIPMITAVRQPAFWVNWDTTVELLGASPEAVKRLLDDLLAQCRFYRERGIRSGDQGKAVAQVWARSLEDNDQNWAIWLGTSGSEWDAMEPPEREELLEEQGVRAFNFMLGQARD